MNLNIVIDILASLTVLTSPVSWFYALPQFFNAIKIKNKQKDANRKKQLIAADEFISIALCCVSQMIYCMYLDSPKQVIMNLIPGVIFLGYGVWGDIINDSRFKGLHFIAATVVWALISHFALSQFMNGLAGTAFQVSALIARLREAYAIFLAGDGRLMSIKSLLILFPNQLCWLCDGLQIMDPFMMFSRTFEFIVSIIQFSVYFLVRPDLAKSDKTASSDKKKQ